MARASPRPMFGRAWQFLRSDKPPSILRSTLDRAGDRRAQQNTQDRSMRMFWIGVLIGLVAMPPALLLAAAWYMLGVPGRGHHGALPALTTEERDLAGRLRAHVVAIASEPHNIGHDEA